MKEPDFYQQKMIARGHSDCIPLIKPYKAIENRIINKWEVPFFNKKTFTHNKNSTIELFYCDSLNIIKASIIAKCSGKDCNYDDEKYEEIYYILIPSKKMEEVFFSYGDFLNFFRKNIEHKEPEFLSASAINQSWQQQSSLPWGKIETVMERQ